MTIPANGYRYAPRHTQPWTAEDDARLYDGSTRAVAVALGRTQVSVMLRRERVQRRRRQMTEDEAMAMHEHVTYGGK